MGKQSIEISKIFDLLDMLPGSEINSGSELVYKTDTSLIACLKEKPELQGFDCSVLAICTNDGNAV